MGWGTVLGQVRPSLLLQNSGSKLSCEPQQAPHLARELAYYPESKLFLLQHRSPGALSIVFFSMANSKPPWRGRKGSSVPKNFLGNTGCMAKAPGERDTTRKTRRREEGESFMVGHILTSGNGMAGGGGCSITLAWSLQSELPRDLRINHWQISTLGRSGTGTGGARGSTSRQLQSSFASAFWTSHEIYFT